MRLRKLLCGLLQRIEVGTEMLRQYLSSLLSRAKDQYTLKHLNKNGRLVPSASNLLDVNLSLAAKRPIRVHAFVKSTSVEWLCLWKACDVSGVCRRPHCSALCGIK